VDVDFYAEMAFQIPKNVAAKRFFPIQKDPNIPCFSYKDIKKEEELGRGNFGTVFKAVFRKETVVVKELVSRRDSYDGKKFLKEAKMCNSLRHENIIGFKGISYELVSLMLEYALFDFTPFGGKESVNALDNFLEFVDLFDLKNLERMAGCIAKDTTRGLLYLHKKGIAHRDLKPANILVSNRHYASLGVDKRNKIMKTRPIICKLGDFGESRSRLLQSRTLIQTCTNHVRIRGS